MPRLPYISDELLIAFTKEVLDKTLLAYENSDEKIHSNVIDPFSALFDSARQGVDVGTWFEQERARQVQKTLQNAIGAFHQNILGSVPGWRNPGLGGGYDLISAEKQVLAELKNKFNTMNSSASENTYRKLSNYIDNEYPGYTAYVVFIVPKYVKDYDSTWSPNQQIMPYRNDIRKSDGESFYALVTGYADALEMLFDTLPDIISKILNKESISTQEKYLLKELFTKAYK